MLGNQEGGRGEGVIKVTKALSTKAELHIGLTDSTVVHSQNLLCPLSPRRPLISLALGGVHRYEQPSSIIRRH